MSNLFLGGNHRGGLTIVKECTADTARLYEPNWTLADPQEDRAEQPARIVQNRFAMVQPQPLRMTVQNALTYSRDDDTLLSPRG